MPEGLRGKLAGRLKQLWQAARTPSLKYSMLTLVAGGFATGIVFWGGFNTAMEATNTMNFCISCHEMRDNVFAEYRTTIHHQNRTGVQATCADCHVPREWVHKFVRKIQASNELYHHFLGSVATKDKFEAKRLTLARHVWSSMKATDSRECRNCHTIESMQPEFQRPRARKLHMDAMRTGQTCIDCHKGIAHKNVRDKLDDKELEELEKPLKQYIREVPASYVEGLKRAEAREAAAAAKAKAELDKAAEAIVAEKLKTAPPTSTPTKSETPAQPVKTETTPSTTAGIDWSKVEAKAVTLFYPGQASFEWVQNSKDHGGARAFLRANERCSECHSKEVKDMGTKIVSGEKLETTPIPSKRPFVDVKVQTAHDGEKVYFRFQWQNAAHTPVPFVQGGKMDPQNQVKLAVMFAGQGIERVEQAGCWVTCHHDSRYMPDAQKLGNLSSSPAAARIDLKEGLTKYLAETRTEIEIKGEDGKLRGGGDKLKSKEDIAALMAKGVFMDLMRFRSGAKPENGYVLEQRVSDGGVAVEMEGKLEGDTWTVVMKRPMKSDKAGDVTLEPGKIYIVNFALHDDHAAARFHHVSFEYKFGIDAKDAEINAVKR